MKSTTWKKIGCALALMLFGVGHAWAQSSVILYGVLDAGIDYISNSGGKPLFKLDSGINQQNNWGLIGNEDLGGGLSAIFKLEGGYLITNGQTAFAGKLFDRSAYVGLASNRWGSIKVGEDYDFLFRDVTFFTNVAQFAPAYSFHLAYDIDRLAGESVSNAIDYETPEIAGFQGGLMYGFSNGGSTDRVLSAGLTYAPHGLMGPFSAALAFTQTQGSSSPSTDATIAQIVFNSNKVYTIGAGARAQLGSKIGLNAIYTFTDLTLPNDSSMITQDFELGATYYFSPTIIFGGGYSYLMQRGVNVAGLTPTQKFGIFSAGIDYLFSKSTDAYLFGNYQRSFGGNQLPGDFLVTAAPIYGPVPGTGVGPTGADAGFSTSRGQAVIQVGIRHHF